MSVTDYKNGYVDGAFDMIDRIDRDFDQLLQVDDDEGVQVFVENAKKLIAKRREITKEKSEQPFDLEQKENENAP